MAFGLAWVLDHADTAEKQDAAAAALVFKTDVLWSQLDALYPAYVTPGRIPPGAWQPGEGLSRRPRHDRRRTRRCRAAARRAAALGPGAGAWVLLAPERALKLDAVGQAVLAEIDGDARASARSSTRLAERYAAPRDRIAEDAGGSSAA